MIAIIKYNAGNARAVANVINNLGYKCVITDDPELIIKSDKVIFPGVGEASSAMTFIKKLELDLLIPELKQPVLGICLGMQLMCNYSEEGATYGLGIFDCNVKLFPPFDIVPHTGWNDITFDNIELFDGIKSGQDLYFVHSYYAELCSNTVASCEYIHPFSAALKRDNFFGTQFHPEKSSVAGKIILNNFLKM